MTTTDIKELVEELRAVAKAPSLTALRPLFSDAADALERQQAVVQAARGYPRGEWGWLKRMGKALDDLDALKNRPAT